jgi:hypothetical protein
MDQFPKVSRDPACGHFSRRSRGICQKVSDHPDDGETRKLLTKWRIGRPRPPAARTRPGAAPLADSGVLALVAGRGRRRVRWAWTAIVGDRSRLSPRPPRAEQRAGGARSGPIPFAPVESPVAATAAMRARSRSAPHSILRLSLEKEPTSRGSGITRH